MNESFDYQSLTVLIFLNSPSVINKNPKISFFENNKFQFLLEDNINLCSDNHESLLIIDDIQRGTRWFFSKVY